MRGEGRKGLTPFPRFIALHSSNESKNNLLAPSFIYVICWHSRTSVYNLIARSPLVAPAAARLELGV